MLRQAVRDIVLALTDQVFYAVIEASGDIEGRYPNGRCKANAHGSSEWYADKGKTKIRSGPESFAQVNLSQAKLLQLDAQNNLSDAAKAAFQRRARLRQGVELQHSSQTLGRFQRFPPTSNGTHRGAGHPEQTGSPIA